MYTTLKTKDLISSQGAAINETWALYLGQFIDDFKRAKPDERIRMIQDPPEKSEYATPYHYALVAGMVDYLCNHNGMVDEKPEWVYRNEYVMSTPYFSMNATGEYRSLMFWESPPELRCRNIFTPGNVFNRV